MGPTEINNPLPARSVQWRCPQRCGNDHVGSNRTVHPTPFSGRTQPVDQTAGLIAVKRTKGPSGALGNATQPASFGIIRRPFGQHPQTVAPQRRQFDRLAHPWRDGNAIHHGVHPSQSARPGSSATTNPSLSIEVPGEAPSSHASTIDRQAVAMGPWANG